MSALIFSVPRTWFDSALRRLLATPHEGAVCSLGLARTGAATVLLAQAPRWLPLSDDATWAGPGDYGVLAVSSSPAELATHYAARLQRRDSHVSLIVVIGAGIARGQVIGLVRAPRGSLAPLDRLELPGSGMHHFALDDNRTGAPLLPPAFGLDWNVSRAAAISDVVSIDAWDRTRRAIGDEPWHRLTALRYGVVGCGRTGSLAATHLVRLGATSLCLVDDDCLAVINLGETDGVTRSDALNKRPKVDALASGLRAILGERTAQIERVAASVTSMRALAALRSCDVIVVCADNGAARLASAHIAGTSQSTARLRNRDIGRPPIGRPSHRLRRAADHPGSACLQCLGGVANTREARAMLRSAEVEHRQRNRPIEQQLGRRGSLRSLNMAAVGFGMRLLEDLVAERVRDSTWLQLEQNAQGGPPALHATVDQRSVTCTECAAAGLGDAGLGSGTWVSGT